MSSSRARAGVRARWVAGAAAGMALVLATPVTASASVAPVPDATAQVAGGVYALAQVGDRTVVGGIFTRVGGKARSNIAAVRADGTVDPLFVPATDGKVDALAVSEDGGTVFIGGRFTTVNGVPRANLAAVDAMTGALVESWQADTTGTYPDVKALTVVGPRLYVGGRFGGIDGTTRKRFAALDAATGTVVTSFRPRPDKGINEIKVSPDGSIVYVGGAFTMLGGQPRVAGGAVHASNGDATSFAPQVDGGNCVTIGLSPDGSTYFAGTENNTVFAFDVDSNTPRWLVKMSGNTQAIAVSDTEVYLGGHFSQVVTTKQKRAYFASMNVADGSVTSWAPAATGGAMGVWALLIDGTHLHSGGVFQYFGTVQQRGYARFTGTP